MFLSGSIALADGSAESKTLLMVADTPVSLAEFQYFYDKDASLDRERHLGVEEFLKGFIDYRLKLQAALDAHVAVATPIQGKNHVYEADESRAYYIYKVRQKEVAEKGGAVKAAQILVRIDQMANSAQQEEACRKAFAIRKELDKGADFSELARRYSDDTTTAQCGGVLPWMVRGTTVKALEDVVFTMKVGAVSQPILSEWGYHIVRLVDRCDSIPYDAVHEDILRELDAQAIRDRIVDNGSETMEVSSAAVLQNPHPVWKGAESEMHDAALIDAVCKKEVWHKAVADRQGLLTFFQQNKRKMKYKGTVPDEVVIADYQDFLEKQWLASLRVKYPVRVDYHVLSQVDKH